MIVSIAKEEKRQPNWKELKRAIKRNFSGLMEVEGDFNPVKILMENIGFPAEYLQVKKTLSLRFKPIKKLYLKQIFARFLAESVFFIYWVSKNVGWVCSWTTSIVYNFYGNCTVRVHRHATKERNAKCRCDLFSNSFLVLFGFPDLAVKAVVQKWFQFTFHIVDWLNS